MSAITSSPRLEPQQPEPVRRPFQRWEFLNPQKELLKNLGTLVAVQTVAAVIFAVLPETSSTSPYDTTWHFSTETYDALNQLCTTSFLAALFTGVGALFTGAYFVKSNQENLVTPEMAFAIQEQIAQALRERSNV